MKRPQIAYIIQARQNPLFGWIVPPLFVLSLAAIMWAGYLISRKPEPDINLCQQVVAVAESHGYRPTVRTSPWGKDPAFILSLYSELPPSIAGEIGGLEGYVECLKNLNGYKFHELEYINYPHLEQP